MSLKKLLIIALCIIVGSFVFTGCGSESGDPAASESGEQSYAFRMSIEEAPGSIQDKYAQKFATLLNESTDGKVTIDIYTMGEIGTEMDNLESLQSGALDFAIISPGTVGSLLPEAQFFNLHFLLSDDMDINRDVLLNGEAIKIISNVYAEKGIKALNFWSEGFFNITSNRPIKSLEDMKGFKIRTMQSPLIISSYKAYDATPTPMPFSEVYSSLQLKMLDGQENPLEHIYYNNLDEVQGYLTLSNHAAYVTTLMVNPDLYESLPADIKTAVEDSVAKTYEYITTVEDEANAMAIEKMTERSGIEIIELTDEAREEFKKASIPVQEQYVEEVGEVGSQILDALEKDIKDRENK